MKIALILLGVVVLAATVFIGGLFTTLKAGAKDGISNYDYKE